MPQISQRFLQLRSQEQRGPARVPAAGYASVRVFSKQQQTMSADNVGIEAAKACGRGSGGDSSKSLVLCPPTVETAEELEGSFSLPSGSAKATPQATEAASCSQASAVSGAATRHIMGGTHF